MDGERFGYWEGVPGEDRDWFRSTMGNAGFDGDAPATGECTQRLRHFVDAALSLQSGLLNESMTELSDADLIVLSRIEDAPWAGYIDRALSQVGTSPVIVLWECPEHRLAVLPIDGKWQVRNLDRLDIDPLDEWSDLPEDRRSDEREPDVFERAVADNAFDLRRYFVPRPHLSTATAAAMRMIDDDELLVLDEADNTDDDPGGEELASELSELSRRIADLAESNRRLAAETSHLRQENLSLKAQIGNARRQIDDAHLEVKRLLKELQG